LDASDAAFTGQQPTKQWTTDRHPIKQRSAEQ
jgi:hypothetical protein